MNKNIAIIGSGFLGLTLALRLSEAGNTVTVYESAPEIGGLASAWRIGDVVWDKHYHVTLLSDSFTRKIVEEIGLADEFEWVETKTGFYTDGKLVSMSNTLEFLQFPPLDLIFKIPSRRDDLLRLARQRLESVGENFGRRLADQTFGQTHV